jgi:SnoaL-like domain
MELNDSRRTTLEQRVARLEAAEDIRHLLFRYTWALDHADFEGIVACFWPDGTFRFGDQEWVGTGAIEDYFRRDRLNHTEMLHYAVNIVVEVADLDTEPDGSGTASAETYLWDLYNRSTSLGLAGTVLAGHYRVGVSRRNGEWRFQILDVAVRWVVPMPQPWALSGDFQPRPELRG